MGYSDMLAYSRYQHPRGQSLIVHKDHFFFGVLWVLLHYQGFVYAGHWDMGLGAWRAWVMGKPVK